MKDRRPSEASVSYGAWVCLAVTGALAFGCTNGLSRSTSSISTSPYTSSTDTSTSVPFTITQVVKDTNNPGSILDLVGDGSGAMGNYCPQTSTNSSSSGGTTSGSTSDATPCNCVLSYTVTDPTTGATSAQQQEAYTVYTEADLIECNYSGVPAGVNSVTVDVHLVSNNSYSNSLNVSLIGNYGAVDVTNIQNFSVANRWQCREIVTLNTISNTIYDPIQSDDPHIYYPLDFYAGNFGWTLAQYAQASQQFATNNTWSCPQNPESSALLNNPIYNMRVYSVADLSGSKLIYPPQSGQVDRSTFYLANVASGAFTMPVNAFIAPTVVTSDSSPLGFGAQPISTGNGTETCPTASMPSGYHWVKVWLFRANLQPRTYLAFPSGTLTPPSGFENIMCNPASLYPCDPSEDPTGCAGDLSTGGAYQCGAGATTLGTGVLTGTLAARILGTAACVTVSPGALNATSASCVNQPPGASTNGSLGCGTDEWTALPANSTNSSDIITNCPPTATGDPLGLCAASNGTEVPIPEAIPKASAVVQNYDGSAERYDYLYVVTPVTVNSVDMETGALGQSYTPYRFVANADCTADDPDTDSTCVASVGKGYKIGYSLKLHDVSTNGDPPAGAARAPVFPVCAIQAN